MDRKDAVIIEQAPGDRDIVGVAGPARKTKRGDAAVQSRVRRGQYLDPSRVAKRLRPEIAQVAKARCARRVANSVLKIERRRAAELGREIDRSGVNTRMGVRPEGRRVGAHGVAKMDLLDRKGGV